MPVTLGVSRTAPIELLRNLIASVFPSVPVIVNITVTLKDWTPTLAPVILSVKTAAL